MTAPTDAVPPTRPADRLRDRQAALDLGRGSLSLRSLRVLAGAQHSRWVLVGLVVITAGYVVSFLVTWITGTARFPWILTELAGVAVGAAALVLFARRRIVSAVYVTIVGVWLELHAAIVSAGGSTHTAALPVFPALVVAAGLLLGGRAAFALALASAATVPATILAARAMHGQAPEPAEVLQMVVVAMAALGSALLTALFLRSLAEVLREALANERRFADEQRRLQQQLEHAQRMEAVGRLAGGVAHDFNNLLMVIGAAAEFLRDSADTEVRGLAQEITAAQQRGARLTRQLLAFARRDVAQSRPLDLAEVVRDMEPLAQKLVGEAVRLRFDLAGPAWIVADAGHVEQILLNLVANARDAMPGGGRLAVEVATDAPGAAPAPGGYVALRVRDTGVGMTDEVRAQAFDPFFTTKPRGKGTGLGLAMVHGIVTQNDGRVTIDSAPGEGTTVQVLWPAASGPAAAAAPVAEAAAAPPAASGTILLVEDDPQARGLIRLQLERAGYRVVEAPDGESAFALAGREPVDLVLTDVVMPGVGGIELARRLGAERPALPVLLMSGYLDDPAAAASGVVSDLTLLHKPFSGERLREAVAERMRAGEAGAGRLSAPGEPSPPAGRRG